LASDSSFFIFMFGIPTGGLESQLQRAHTGYTQTGAPNPLSSLFL